MYNFLISESALSTAPIISKKNPNTVEFIAVLQEANVPNRNGRIYHKAVLEQALNSPYIQERLRTKSFFCEAGHPSDSSIQRQMTIDQRNIAAIIKEFWWEGNLLKGRLETADTAVGRDMKGLIEQGSRVAFSLRAQGNVHHDAQLNVTIVEAPIQIATYDWVVNPSHDKAFLESICESTYASLFGSRSNQLVLTESARLFEEGKLIPLTEEASLEEVIDYAKHFSKKIKPLSETYFYDKDDKLTVDGNFAILRNGTVTKKTMLEDYLLKDIRNKIKVLGEEVGEVAVEPVHDESKPEELQPEEKTEDVYPDDEHEQKEEVKEVIVESEVAEPSEPKEEQYKVEDEIAPSDKPEEPEVKTEIKSDEIVVADHDHADEEGKEVRDAIHEEVGEVAVEPVHDESKPEELQPEEKTEDIYPAEDHEQAEEVKEVIVESRKIKFGKDYAVKPIHDNSKPEIETPEVKIADIYPTDEHEQKEEVKEVIVEEVGEVAVEPVHDDSKPEELQPEEKTEDVYPDDEHEQKEEVKEVIVESRKIKFGKDYAAKPVHDNSKPEIETTKVETKDIYPDEEHSQKEEIKEVLVESRKIKFGKRG